MLILQISSFAACPLLRPIFELFHHPQDDVAQNIIAGFKEFIAMSLGYSRFYRNSRDRRPLVAMMTDHSTGSQHKGVE